MKQHAADFRASVNLVLDASDGQHELAHDRKQSCAACIFRGGVTLAGPANAELSAIVKKLQNFVAQRRGRFLLDNRVVLH